jgi:hypothetical protein
MRGAPQRELLQPAELEQAGADRVQLGEDRKLRTRTESPLGLREQLRDGVDTRERSLRTARRAAASEQPHRLVAGLYPRDYDLGRRIADVDAGDQQG